RQPFIDAGGGVPRRRRGRGLPRADAVLRRLERALVPPADPAGRLHAVQVLHLFPRGRAFRAEGRVAARQDRGAVPQNEPARQQRCRQVRVCAFSGAPVLRDAAPDQDVHAGTAARGLPGRRRAGGAGRCDRPEECAVHHRACRLPEARAAASQAVLPPGVRRPGASDRGGPSAAILRLSRPAEERAVKGGAGACQDRCLSRCCSSTSSIPSCRATSSTRSSRSTRRTRPGATGKTPGREGSFRPGIACGCRSGTCACPASGCSRTWRGCASIPRLPRSSNGRGCGKSASRSSATASCRSYGISCAATGSTASRYSRTTSASWPTTGWPRPSRSTTLPANARRMPRRSTSSPTAPTGSSSRATATRISTPRWRPTWCSRNAPSRTSSMLAASPSTPSIRSRPCSRSWKRSRMLSASPPRGLPGRKVDSELFAAAIQKQGADPEAPDEYRAKGIFWVPPEARWSKLKAQAKQPTIGQLVDDAMAGIERDNPSLKAVLPKEYGRPALDKQRLGQLIDLVSN